MTASLKSSDYKEFRLWLLKVLCLHGLLALFIWATMRPKTPIFRIVDFEILAPSSQNTTFHPIGGDRNTTIAFHLEMYNPNKRMGVHYKNVNVTFHSNGASFGAAAMGPFYQHFHETTQYNSSVKVDLRLQKAISAMVSNGTADLEVGVATAVWYRILGVTTKQHELELNGHLPIGLDGKMNGAMKIMLNPNHKIL